MSTRPGSDFSSNQNECAVRVKTNMQMYIYNSKVVCNTSHRFNLADKTKVVRYFRDLAREDDVGWLHPTVGLVPILETELIKYRPSVMRFSRRYIHTFFAL